VIGNVVGGVGTTEITGLSLHKQGNTGNSKKTSATGTWLMLQNPRIFAILCTRFPAHGTGNNPARIRVTPGK